MLLLPLAWVNIRLNPGSYKGLIELALCQSDAGSLALLSNFFCSLFYVNGTFIAKPPGNGLQV